MDTRIEQKAQRLVDQAIRLHGMSRRQATRWANDLIVADFETAARNADRIATFYSETLKTYVTAPA